MTGLKSRSLQWSLRATAIGLLLNLLLVNLGVEAAQALAFPEKFMFRLSYFSIEGADTDLTVLSSSSKLGTGFSFADDLGGDDSLTIPRIDGFYRINQQHRIEFAAFRFERDGRKRLTIDLDIGDESYTAGETVISEITYELFRIGYAYSFYRSAEAELGITVGLNVTSYEFDYELVDGSSADKSKANGPLPMFGVRMGYVLNSTWSMHYLAEVLFIESRDTEGSLLNYEVDLRYRLNQQFMLSVGVNWFSVDLTSSDDEWNGRIADTHRGFLLSGSYYID